MKYKVGDRVLINSELVALIVSEIPKFQFIEVHGYKSDISDPRR